MGRIKKILPVKYFIAMISKDEEGFEIAMDALKERYGNFDIISETIPFDFTEYYKDEMGEGLLRKFAVFEKLMDPADLADIKIFTNELEDKMAAVFEDETHRRVNLDCGYIEMAKLILASTKNFYHRVYLRDGIYAEVTLHWKKKEFRHFEHTFPDYRTEFYKNYFKTVRDRYREQVAARISST